MCFFVTCVVGISERECAMRNHIDLIFSIHARRRMEERNLTPGEVFLVYRFGERSSTDECRLVFNEASFLRAKRRGHYLSHLKGVVLIVREEVLVTLFRNKGVLA